MKTPALLLAFDDLGGNVLPRYIDQVLGKARSLDRHHIGNERIEEPLLFVAARRIGIIMTEFAKLLANLDAEPEAPIPQYLAGFSIVAFGIDGQRGQWWVKGSC